MSTLVSRELSAKLGSRLTVGCINMGLMNRIIIDDLSLNDLSGREMLRVARLSAKFDILPLFSGKISVGTVQLFGFDINIEKQAPEDTPNFQFVLDALASRDTVKRESDLDLRINSLLMRRGRLSYHVLSEKETPGKFNARHINLQNIIASISLKTLQADSVNAAIKRMSIEEANSGFKLKKLSLKLTANSHKMDVANFSIDLPHTSLKTDTIRMSYDSIGALKDFANKVQLSFHLLPSCVALKDLSAFMPAFSSFKDELWIEVSANGSINSLTCSNLSVSADNDFQLHGETSFQNLSKLEDAYVFGELSNLYISPEGMAFFARNLTNSTEVPPPLRHLGAILFRGEISGYFTDLVTYGRIQTDLGTIQTDVKLSSKEGQNAFAYSGTVKTDNFELGEMLDNAKLGKVTLGLTVDGFNQEGHYPSVSLDGEIALLEYSQYAYKNIQLDGEYKQGGFNGKVKLDDENVSFYLDGNINAASPVPTFNFSAFVDHFKPHALNLATRYEDAEMSVRLKADFTGGSINEMKGEINIDSLQYITPKKSYFLDNLKIRAAHRDDGIKQLTLTSNFARGSIEGDYSYHTLPLSVLNIMRRYVPALIPPVKNEAIAKNNFSFDLHIYDTEVLAALLNMPLKLYMHSTLKGYFNDKAGRLRIEGYFPRLRYGNCFIESGMLLCENPDDQFHAQVRLTNRKENGAVNLSIDAHAEDNRVKTVLNWGNSQSMTYSGQLNTVTRFIRQQMDTASLSPISNKHYSKQPPLLTIIDVNSTDVILNDTLWQIHPSQVVIDSGKVHINNFLFSRHDRHLHINGTLSDQPQDTVRLDLQKINIGYVFDIADLGVNFQGEATGPAYASRVLKEPVMFADLFIHNLGLNNGLLGDANIHGEWHHDVKGIYLDARIREGGIAHTHVNGYIYPLKPTSSLDLMIEANNTNLKFIHFYMQSITPEFSGRATGKVHFYGKFKALAMEGKVLGDASLKVEVLNTTFSVKDSILIMPEGLTFRNNRIFDTQGHQGMMSGELRYDHFKDLRYRFQFSANNMLVMDTQESADFPFYGTVYGTGNATISGNARDGVNIDVAMTTNRNTSFTYIKDFVTTAASNQFIKFVDKTPHRTVQDSVYLSYYDLAQQEIAEEEDDTDIHLNLLIDATQDAAMRIIMDPIAGDYINARGSGNLRVEFYNKGDVKLFGSYRISQGLYKFSLQEVIRKDFTIKDGSTIAFNGNPFNATLDISAGYVVNSASLNDLIANAANYVDQTNVKVECIMNLTGQLTFPDIKLSLDLPNERDEVQALVRNYISTDEQMNTQILYLLSIGKFYTSESVGATQNSDMMSSVLSSTISGQLNNALSNIINSNNWNFGTNFSTGEKGWTDVEFETMLSGQLLNNRLLINGNFGYRDSPIANTNFVGDFEAEWLVNPSGTIRLKAYNESNDRYYTRTNLTTQGIGIIFRKDFNKWRELFFWTNILFRHHKNEPADEPSSPDNEAE